jgi:hypothetical protein
MRISEVMDFDAYYRDPRFAKKKARNGSWKARCGDNIYFRKDGGWVQALAFHHKSRKNIAQDTRYPRVFISNYFFYFGEESPDIPEQFVSLVKTGRGCEYHEDKTVDAFVKWLEREYRPGIIGQPRDRDENSGTECNVRTRCTR